MTAVPEPTVHTALCTKCGAFLATWYAYQVTEGTELPWPPETPDGFVTWRDYVIYTYERGPNVMTNYYWSGELMQPVMTCRPACREGGA